MFQDFLTLASLQTRDVQFAIGVYAVAGAGLLSATMTVLLSDLVRLVGSLFHAEGK